MPHFETAQLCIYLLANFLNYFWTTRHIRTCIYDFKILLNRKQRWLFPNSTNAHFQYFNYTKSNSHQFKIVCMKAL